MWNAVKKGNSQLKQIQKLHRGWNSKKGTLINILNDIEKKKGHS
jgi:hypothetical protein